MVVRLLSKMKVGGDGVLEEMDYQTIENTLGLTNGSLRGILGRALATMRKQLALAASE